MNNVSPFNSVTSLFQHLLNFKIRFGTVFIGSFIFYISCMWLGYCVYGDSPLANLTTVLLSSALGLIMVIALWLGRDRSSFELLCVLSYSMCLFFFPRLLQYLLFRQEDLKTLYLLFPIHWTADDINKGLAYVVLGTLVLVIGLFLGGELFYKCSKHTVNDQIESGVSIKLPSLLSIILAGVIIYFVDGYYTIYLGLSASSNCNFESIPYKWLTHIFSGDIYIFAVMALLGFHFKDLHFKYKLYLYLSLLVYIAYTLMLGSRGGILRLVIIAFVVAVAIYRDPEIKVRTMIQAAIVVLILSICSYLIGTEIRELKRYSCGDGIGETIREAAVSGIKSNIEDGYATNHVFTDKYKSDPRNLERPVFPIHVKKILDRLGEIDYAIGIVAIKPNEAFKNEYINFRYILKNITNNVLPGTPYPEAQLMTNNMFPVLYRNLTMEHVKENFLSEPFTIWGLSFIFFGYVGGLLFILISSISIQMLYLYISHKSEYFIKGGSYIFKAYFLWIVAGGAYFFTFGFDHAALIFVYGFLEFVTTFSIIYSIDKLQPFFRTGTGSV